MSIDTSTTAGKIAVMQAYEDGKDISYKRKSDKVWISIGGNLSWSWDYTDYRIKPQSLTEAAIINYTGAASFESYAQAYEAGAIFGAQWQKDQEK